MLLLIVPLAAPLLFGVVVALMMPMPQRNMPPCRDYAPTVLLLRRRRGPTAVFVTISGDRIVRAAGASARFDAARRRYVDIYYYYVDERNGVVYCYTPRYGERDADG